MLENSIWDIPQEQLDEAKRQWGKLHDPADTLRFKKLAMDSLPLFPELAMVTEKGQLFQNARHHIEWYLLLQGILTQNPDLIDDDYSPKSIGYNVTGKPNKKIILEAPREHSKTTVFSVNYPLWRIIHNPNIRIILVSNTGGQAESYLREIAGHIERDPVFIELFGDLRPKYTDKWTNSEIIVNRTAFNLKDPTVSATGMGGSILSRRAELIIIDDILSPKNTRTQEQRQQVKDWFWNVLEPVLVPNGEILVVGTAWDDDDLLEDLLSKSRFDVRVRYKAIPDEEEIDPITHEPKLLWPQLFTYDQLMEKKENDPIAFYRQYQNEVKQMANHPVPASSIHLIPEIELPKIKRAVVAVDPAFSEDDTSGNAQSAIVAAGVGDDGLMYILRSRAGYWDEEELLTQIELMYWGVDTSFGIRPEHVVVEDVAAQKWLIRMIRRRLRIPADGIKPTSDKESRLRSTSPFMKTRELMFVAGVNKELITQLVGWGKEKLKDLADAFVFAVWDLTSKGGNVRTGQDKGRL